MKKLSKIDKIEKTVGRLEKTVGDILIAVNSSANDNEKRFQGLETRMDKIESRMDKMESRMDSMENKMVTKSYLDNKLADLRSDLVMLVRKGDAKFCKSVDILRKRKVITKTEAKQVLAMEPFPKTIAS